MEVAQKRENRFLILEILAIIFGLLYTVLYIKEVKLCFVFAILGAGLYTFLCVKKQILAEAFLQFFYIPMAIYGWYNWGGEFKIEIYSFSQHIMVLAVSILAMIGLTFYLKKNTESKSPFLDSFTTIFSLAGTWLMVNFINEMWLYLIAVNVVSMFLYYARGMKLSVLLYAFYTYISLAMWFGWELFF
ncbi:MAG: nicotinamide riboside transporter PnuC [Flavobacteriales bacterium]